MSRKKTTHELRAEASKNLKSLQEAVKVQETDNAQTIAPVTSVPVESVPTSAPTPPDPDLLHKVAEFAAGSKIRFYCMKCKSAKSTKIDEVYSTLQGHKRAKGICPTCGKKVTRGHLDIAPKAV